MNRGKNIRIYVSPSGIRHAELWGWTGQAIAAPRSNVEGLKDWKAQLSRPGVYILIGADENAPKAYVGESEDILFRLKDHIANKEFWTEIVAFTSKDDHLTKAHIEYLEHRIINLAQNAKRFTLDNENSPTSPALPRGEIDGLEDFVDNLRVLLLVLGSRLLEPLRAQSSTIESPGSLNDESDVFSMTVKGATAYGRRSPEGFLVLRESGASSETVPSCPAGYLKLRNNLISQGNIVQDPRDSQRLVFSTDVLFRSPSAAACVVSGQSTNGRDSWLDKSRRSLGEVENEEIEAES